MPSSIRGFLILTLVLSACGLLLAGDGDRPARSQSQAAEQEFAQLRDSYVAKFKPLYIESATAWWEANTTGKDEAYARKEKAEKALAELHSDRATFAKLRSLKADGLIADPIMARELDVMYRKHLPGQADPELQNKIIALENQVAKTFSTHRSSVGGKDVSENDVRKILSDSKDSKECEAAWKGYMEVGAKASKILQELVSLRNQLAKSLGYKNFYVMKLGLDEIEEQKLLALFKELDELTRGPFGEVKKAIDTSRAARFGVKPEELRPWHFGDLFFQEAPNMDGPNLDEVYEGKDLLEFTKRYYTGIGLETEAILTRSDLYEKPGKNPHAFSTSLDRDQNIRVLCNLKPNLYWADTLMHELGHAVYDSYVEPRVPFLLHEASHSITTEGYAMMMGAMVKNPEYLTKIVGLSSDQAAKYAEAARRSLRCEKLIFSRWTQVMMRFEHGMYSNPDQDLGKLWWDLKRDYQLLSFPEGAGRADYAAKVHVVTEPVYYHSYMMGELFACQVHDTIATKVVGVRDPMSTCFVGKKEAGKFMREKVFGPGNMYSWNELTKRATGESLSAKSFAARYVKG
jgi:peptidyl-dipeptidase A